MKKRCYPRWYFILSFAIPFFCFTQPSSTECLGSHKTDTNTPTCRICQTSGNSEDENVGELLVSPCNCRGSLGFVHKICMEKWLSVRNQDTCELCHFTFMTKRRFNPHHGVGMRALEYNKYPSSTKRLFCGYAHGVICMSLDILYMPLCLTERASVAYTWWF